MRNLGILFALLLTAPVSAQTGITVIRNARVVDGTGAPAVVETVVIRANRIVAVGPNVRIPDGSRVIDAQGKTLIPGIFDLQPVGPLVDDFERADGRTGLGTLRTNGTDQGIDHSKILFMRMPHKGTDHSLMIQGQMGPKARNFVLLHVPLTPGGIELADISKYQGVSFDARGEGTYRLKLVTYAVRNGEDFNASFNAGAEWTTQRIAFPSLAREGTPVEWTGRDVRELTFELSGPAGSSRWLDLDNIRFY